MKSLSILKCRKLQANKLVTPYKNMQLTMTLFYLLRQNIDLDLPFI